MCGFIFQLNKDKPVDNELFRKVLNGMSWRGPDAQKVITTEEGGVYFGHCRLSILDPVSRSDQPMVSACGRYLIIFNGEIYNHFELRRILSLNCKTNSDTETVLEAFAKIGRDVFQMLEGMFSILIYDTKEHSWVLSRDAFGIKPLFISETDSKIVIGSESAAVAEIVNAAPDENSLIEWRLIRRPMPGKSFFEGVNEVLPGSILDSLGHQSNHWSWKKNTEKYSQDVFEDLMIKSVQSHELSDVENVSLLSGGLDSAIIAAISKVDKCYTVGLESNNEFLGAEDTANQIKRSLSKILISSEELEASWRYLTKLRKEPLSLPNEGLIYAVCSKMQPMEKVVLTGEGADELLFGYDGIYKWSLKDYENIPDIFLKRYGYSEDLATERLKDYVQNMMHGKSGIDFVEDFFYQVHLPGLLRRMDFASMAASKEARVPFVDKNLISYMYRRSSDIKINDSESKIPLRLFAKKLGLHGALERKKIGFSAQANKELTRQEDYKKFQQIIMETLGW
jgi:asparagine synthase (glutamine-hydrolysing)